MQNQLNAVPAKPGVYFFKNKKGQIIYIGKALLLRHRLKSYFAKNITDPKTKQLVSQIADFDYQTVPSEFEALLLEAKLVKNHQPKYNIQLKDSKRPLYIAITKPPHRVLAQRRPELEKNLLDWYGPFPSGVSVRQVLRTIRRVFPYCSCQKSPQRQCLYSHLGLCPGQANLYSKTYCQNITQIRKILSGKTRKLLKSLEKKMNEKAKQQNFEQAQAYKQQLQSLQYVTADWKNIPNDKLSASTALTKLHKLLIKYQGIDPTIINKIEGYDVSNLGSQIVVGAMAVFTNGLPDNKLYRKFRITSNISKRRTLKRFPPKKTPVVGIPLTPVVKELTENLRQNDPAGIYQIVRRRFNHPEWIYPQLILLDGGKAQVSAAFEALKEKNLVGSVCLLGLMKKEETIIIPGITKNKISSWKLLNYSPRSEVRRLLQQVRDESHRFAQKYYKLIHYKKTIAL